DFLFCQDIRDRRGFLEATRRAEQARKEGKPADPALSPPRPKLQEAQKTPPGDPGRGSIIAVQDISSENEAEDDEGQAADPATLDPVRGTEQRASSSCS
ncbi:unnamed protein product, partial [Amoebophrya sp. A25]